MRNLIVVATSVLLLTVLGGVSGDASAKGKKKDALTQGRSCSTDGGV